MGEVPSDLAARLAGELEHAAGLIEELAVQLCTDDVVFARHAGSLQRFDLVTQIVGEIANVLRFAGSPSDMLGMIRLDAMRERITQSLVAG